MEEPPVACSLSPDELQQRRGLLAELAKRVIERRETSDGYVFRYSAEQFTRVARMIELERQCCRFLRFRLTVEPEGGPLWLELTGPDGTKEFLDLMS